MPKHLRWLLTPHPLTTVLHFTRILCHTSLCTRFFHRTPRRKRLECERGRLHIEISECTKCHHTCNGKTKTTSKSTSIVPFTEVLTSQSRHESDFEICFRGTHFTQSEATEIESDKISRWSELIGLGGYNRIIYAVRSSIVVLYTQCRLFITFVGRLNHNGYC